MLPSRCLFAVGFLLASSTVALAGGRPNPNRIARAFDQGEVDRACLDAREAYGAPHHLRVASGLREQLDRCAFELAAREASRDAYAGYLASAPERSVWAPIAARALCSLDRGWPGCADGQMPVVSAPTAPKPGRGPVDDSGLPSVSDPLRTGARHEADVALVIGLEDYPFASDVPHARRDAEAFANHLRYARGIPDDRIVVLTRGSVEAFRDAAERTARLAQRDSTVWVYFAGHGAAHPVSRARVLLGDDLRPDPSSLSSRGMPVEDLIRAAQGRAGRVVAVLDTCFAGTGRDGGELVPGGRFAIPTQALRLEGVVEWAATGPGEIALPLDAARHGAFTYLVLGALRGWADGELDGQRDGVVTLDEANVFVRRVLRMKGLNDMTPSVSAPDALRRFALASPAPEVGPGW